MITITTNLISYIYHALKEKEIKVILFDKIRKNPSLLMILCCALPIIVVLSLSYLKILGSWGYYDLFLLCPLAHVLIFKNSHAKQTEEVVKKASIKF